MIDSFCPNPATARRLSTGPLGCHIDTVVQQWQAQGYCTWRLKYAMRLLADLSTWLQQQAVTLTELDEQQTQRFLQARHQRYRPTRNDRAILNQLLTQLRAVDVIEAPKAGTGNCEQQRIEEQFQHYLRQQRGLAEATVRRYHATAQRFLNVCFGTKPLRLEALSANDVIGFMLRQTCNHSPTLTSIDQKYS